MESCLQGNVYIYIHVHNEYSTIQFPKGRNHWRRFWGHRAS